MYYETKNKKLLFCFFKVCGVWPSFPAGIVDLAYSTVTRMSGPIDTAVNIKTVGFTVSQVKVTFVETKIFKIYPYRSLCVIDGVGVGSKRLRDIGAHFICFLPTHGNMALLMLSESETRRVMIMPPPQHGTS